MRSAFSSPHLPVVAAAPVVNLNWALKEKRQVDILAFKVGNFIFCSLSYFTSTLFFASIPIFSERGKIWPKSWCSFWRKVNRRLANSSVVPWVYLFPFKHFYVLALGHYYSLQILLTSQTSRTARPAPKLANPALLTYKGTKNTSIYMRFVKSLIPVQQPKSHPAKLISSRCSTRKSKT